VDRAALNVEEEAVMGNVDDPFNLILSRLDQHGCRIQRRGVDTARVQCPTHRDTSPSLVVTQRGDRVLLKCFGGCRAADIVKALGLGMADLFAPHTVAPRSPRIVATYEYRDLNGVVIAQKVRLEPKAFRWRRPDPLKPGEWRWGLDGQEPGLYRIHDCVNVHQLFCVEGEKAVELLWALGVPAVCPPSGASRWAPEWSAGLYRIGCRELFILPDADKTGNEHAERVAAASLGIVDATGGTPMAVKIVRLPGLQVGSDAFDWLNGPHTYSELCEIVSRQPYWTPGATERAREERRRALTCKRVRRHRERRRAADGS
jgi:putative DNA primase/helicase